jgi:transposase
VVVAGRVLVDDELWAVIEPLIPRVRRRRVRPGRRRLDDRAVLNGILFVLHTGIAWRLLPQELGFGSGVTCWRRLREWQAAGVWERLHDELLVRLNRAGEIDWERAVVDSSHIRALLGGPTPGRPRSIAPARAASTTS